MSWTFTGTWYVGVLYEGVHPRNRWLVQDFKKLRVWHDAQSLAVRVYEVTEHFPRREHFGLSAQMRRSAISVGSNIAEGCGRNGPAEMSRFLQISIASACEPISQLDVADRLGLMSAIEGQDLTDIADHVRRMLIKLQANVERRRGVS
jgi:four helix bundle protein